MNNKPAKQIFLPEKLLKSIDSKGWIPFNQKTILVGAIFRPAALQS